MRKIFLLSAIIMILFLAGCGDDSAGGGGSNDPSTAALETFTDDVKGCTPYLTNSFSPGGSTDLSQWAAWNPNLTGSVLGKLFNPSNGGDECFYTHIAILDSHIGMVNEFRASWEAGGQHTINAMTATIDNTVTSVAVPYLKLYYPGLVNVAVDREITLVSGDLTVHMAFRISGSVQIIVEQYTDGSDLSGVYYAERDGDLLRIWHASVRESKIQFAWDADLGDKTFRITECTDWGEDENWEVMGGGSVASDNAEMAFISRNCTNNGSGDEYYVATTLYGLAHWYPLIPVLADATHPNGQGVLAYVDEDMIQCIQFLPIGEYPNSVSDLTWSE